MRNHSKDTMEQRDFFMKVAGQHFLNPRVCSGKHEMGSADFQDTKIVINNETFSSDKKKANQSITDN